LSDCAAIATNWNYEIVLHLPYSPNLTPSSYFFSNEKIAFVKIRFESNDEVIDKTNAYFAELDKLHYTDKIKKLENH